MSDTAVQRAMLNFVEILMNNNGPLSISQLAGHFGGRNFDAEMRAAAGGNEAGLKKLLLKYPSLFTIEGNLVSLYDHEENDRIRSQSPFSDTSEPSLPDVSVEMEAVRYFQNKFARKRERWMPIASLAGHLSQASREVRNVVGPQLLFRSWLLRHPHIFEICDNLVGLQEDIAAVVLNVERVENSNLAEHRQQNNDIWKLAISDNTRIADDGSPFSPLRRKNRNEPVDSDYAALFFVAVLLERHQSLTVEDICKYVDADGPVSVQNVLNRTGIEKFLFDHPQVFVVADGNVKLNLNQVANGENEDEIIKEGSGIIYHVAKLWGIVDLGQHEHVFFDRSILGSDVADLQADYRIGEKLHFRALAAPKRSRAKWKAVAIWKSETAPDDKCQISLDNLRLTTGDDILSVTSISGDSNASYVAELIDAELDANEAQDESIGELKLQTISGNDAEKTESKLSSALLDENKPDEIDEGTMECNQKKRFVSVACQTTSTGDIIATNLYQDV